MNILKLETKKRKRFIFMDKITHVDISRVTQEVKITFVGGDYQTWDLILVNEEASKFWHHFNLIVSEQGELY